MANGIRAIQVDAAAITTTGSSTLSVPCYLGSAPIWQVDRDDWADLAGKTILATSLSDVKDNIGFSLPKGEVFPKALSLSMVANYHLNVEKRMPIILIVNKSAFTTSNVTSETATFVKGKAVIEEPYMVLNSLKIGSLVKGEDYEAVFDSIGQSVIITDLKGTLTSESIEYDKVDPDSVTFSTDTYEEIDYIGQNVGVVPSTISAPLFDGENDSKGNKVMIKLAEICEGVVDKHYYVQAVGQLVAGTRSEAITEKEAINSHKIKVCWPFARIGSYVYPVSLIFAAKKQTVDANHDGVPYVSASNEPVDITNLCDGDGAVIRQLELEADSLVDKGIATMAFVTGMKWVTWGTRMANYNTADKGSIAPNRLMDVNVQMMDYICNDFQGRYGDRIHKPMSIRDVNNILNEYTTVLRGYVSNGYLVAGSIAFEASENSTADIADGKFVYNIDETNVPAANEIIAYVTYNAEALEGYFE